MINKMLKILIASLIFINCKQIYGDDSLDISAEVKRLPSGEPNLVISRGNTLVHNIKFDEKFNDDIQVVKTMDSYVITGLSDSGTQNIKLQVFKETRDYTIYLVSRTYPKDVIVSDCIDLENLHWYGGPQQKYQYWPVEKLTLTNYSYVTKEADNAAITERYWLNSKGGFIYVDLEVPLFINQNSIHPNQLCLTAKKALPYDTHGNDFKFKYYIGIGENPKHSHMVAVKYFLNKPTGHPDANMVKYPIWSTWARYKRDIDADVVIQFADEIIQHNFTNSQYELDDDWEICYGALTFNTNKFPNIKQTVQQLNQKGFRVTLWIHPFINKNCEPYYTDSKSRGYFVQDHEGNTDTQWWNSEKSQAAYIDFTKPEVAEWFSNRLRAVLAESGIDSFKFDAGESSWSPPDPVQNGPPHLNPSTITQTYVETVAKFGNLVEVRAGQNTQHLPIFLRMIDKDSNWDFNNGLPTLVTTLLQLNMVGYPLVLPDMIGGNGYDGHPEKEMFIRWLAANVFMPSLQYSYVPWDYDNETIEIAHKFTNLHAEYANVIVKRFELAVATGEPVNPPLWWISPYDQVAQGIYDQFLLGEDIIAAPVLEKGKVARDIYLPRGKWKDGNSDRIYDGPYVISNYPTPLDVLPYFIRVK